MGTEIDFFTKLPRRKITPYSFMSEEQIKNTRKDALVHFYRYPSPPPDITRQYKDRFTHYYDKNQVRGRGVLNHSYMDEHITRDLPLQHNSSRYGAAFPWGPEKIGHPTIRNNLHQDCHRFLNIDVYKRNATNYPGVVTHRYGRAAPGYKAQRYANDHPWFGSEIKLNQTQILEDIVPKPTSYYKSKLKYEMVDSDEFNPYQTTYDEVMKIRRKAQRTLSSLEQRLNFQQRARKGLV